MTKADLVERVTAQISRTAGPMISKKDCARVVDSFLDAIKEALQEQKNIECRISNVEVGDEIRRADVSCSRNSFNLDIQHSIFDILFIIRPSNICSVAGKVSGCKCTGYSLDALRTGCCRSHCKA